MGEPTVHLLKTVGTCWEAMARGEKKFEVRKNNRFFQRGDIVRLQRLDDDGGYSIDPESKSRFDTRDLHFRIGWILQGGQFGIEPGYIVFSLEPVDP